MTQHSKTDEMSNPFPHILSRPSRHTRSIAPQRNVFCTFAACKSHWYLKSLNVQTQLSVEDAD